MKTFLDFFVVGLLDFFLVDLLVVSGIDVWSMVDGSDVKERAGMVASDASITGAVSVWACVDELPDVGLIERTE